MQNVSKEIFLNSLECLTLGWLTRSGQFQKTRAMGNMFRMEQGIKVGRIAQKLYPEGILVDEQDMESASMKTKSLMNNPKISTIFEGAFISDGFSTRADILKRKNNNWHMIEVKSGVKDKADFINDMAYTTMVIELSGFNVYKDTVMLISKDFRSGMKNESLFIEIDHTGEVFNRVCEFKRVFKQIKKLTKMPEKPDPFLQFECRRCQIFKECMGKGIDNHIFDIPRLSKSTFDELIESNIICIEDIPDESPLIQSQDIVRVCVQTKKPFVSDDLKEILESILWPAYYLDFEAVTTAIPLYPNIAPYDQIPTQYSIHKCSKPDFITDHFEYLADPRKDCRRELAKNLNNDLKGGGNIIVYSNFEKRIITGLSRLCPDLSEELDLLVDRLIDLEAIIRKNFYHPDFKGSTSIKRTLPVLVPDMSYNGLEISDGDSAMAVFAYLALDKYEYEKAEAIKKRLLDYCKQDTLAMVKLHKRLIEYL